MFHRVFEEYCKDKKGTTPWDMFDITQAQWRRCRREKKLSKKNAETICRMLNIFTTDDLDKLAKAVFIAYYNKKDIK